MKVIKNDSAISLNKPDGTRIKYFLFDEYEIHSNELKPNSIQQWHHHEKIWETLYVIEGNLSLMWKNNENILEEKLEPGDVVEMGKESHSIANNSKDIVRFIIVKQMLSGSSKRELFKQDKIVDNQSLN
ncbi:MAG: cupin domain-containing protein [Candidatus Levybacteria bacterium]|nr:cupin domain-containing protein [Candidatus Levybacteria bacterium]